MRAVLQASAAECALACLAMVLDHHGAPVGLAELRRRFPVSLKGARLADLMRWAALSGLETRPLRVDLPDLRRLALPAILHWNLDHYVVLARAGRRRVLVHDPATGTRRLRAAELSRHFTGVALELVPGDAFELRPRPPAVRLRQLTGKMHGLRRALALVLVLSFALQVFVIVAPFLLQWTVDQALVSADRHLLALLAAAFLLLLLLQVGTGVLRGLGVAWLSARLATRWTNNVFTHLLRLPLSWFDSRHLGDVVSRIGSVRAIQRTLTTSFVEAVVDGAMALVTLAMMFVYSRRLAAVSLLAVCLYAILRSALFRPVRDLTGEQLACAAKQQSHLLESLRGIQAVKLAGIEPQRAAGQANLVNEAMNREFRLACLGVGFGGASGLVFGIERIAVIWLGALLVLERAFSIGMLMAYLAYKDQFAARVAALIDRAVELSMLRLHGERLADIALTAPEPRAGGAQPPPEDARVAVEGLSFRYGEGEPWIIRELCLEVGHGECVALIGPSGCGKTTLVKLLVGLLEPCAGRIRIGGRELPRRGAVAAVLQDDGLFAGSIAENIALGEPAPELARVEAAARLASVHRELAALPMGYHTPVGDMGSVLSGGQKQRVLLARSLYRRPRVLVLDEATSHLDVRRERLVNEAVRRLALTRIVVAHRPQTIAMAARVLVLHEGRIVRELRPQAPAP